MYDDLPRYYYTGAPPPPVPTPIATHKVSRTAIRGGGKSEYSIKLMTYKFTLQTLFCKHKRFRMDVILFAFVCFRDPAKPNQYIIRIYVWTSAFKCFYYLFLSTQSIGFMISSELNSLCQCLRYFNIVINYLEYFRADKADKPP